MTMFPLHWIENLQRAANPKIASRCVCSFYRGQQTYSCFFMRIYWTIKLISIHKNLFHSILKWFFSFFSSFEIRLQSTLISMKLNQYSNQIIVMYILYFTIHLSRLKQICDSEVRNSFFFFCKIFKRFFICMSYCFVRVRVYVVVIVGLNSQWNCTSRQLLVIHFKIRNLYFVLSSFWWWWQKKSSLLPIIIKLFIIMYYTFSLTIYPLTLPCIQY